LKRDQLPLEILKNVMQVPEFPSSNPPNTSSHNLSGRHLSNSSSRKIFDGLKPDDHITRKKDKGNIQHDAAKGGKAERASGERSAAASER
jgi:hypothetical protein